MGFMYPEVKAALRATPNKIPQKLASVLDSIPMSRTERVALYAVTFGLSMDSISSASQGLYLKAALEALGVVMSAKGARRVFQLADSNKLDIPDMDARPRPTTKELPLLGRVLPDGPMPSALATLDTAVVGIILLILAGKLREKGQEKGQESGDGVVHDMLKDPQSLYDFLVEKLPTMQD